MDPRRATLSTSQVLLPQPGGASARTDHAEARTPLARSDRRVNSGSRQRPAAALAAEPGDPTDRSLRTASGPSGDTPAELELDAHEELLVVLRGIGASMFLTSRRLIVARDGVERRPRSGLQSYDLDGIRHIRIEMGSAPSGRVAVPPGEDTC